MDVGLKRLDPNVPDPVESRRRAAGKLVRIAYGTCVFGLLAFLVIYFGAPLVFLRGPGIVSAPRQVISLPYVVQVVALNVGPGEAIVADAEIGRVRSPEHDSIIANYMRGLVELASREAELRIKARVAQESIEAARSHLRLTEEAVQRIEAAPTRGTLGLTFQVDSYGARAQALKSVLSQEAEATEAVVQLASLGELHQRLQQHVDRVERDFAGGRVASPIAGVVSTGLARPGQSLVAGSPIAEIFDTTDIFVDWFIPNRRLVDPKVGNAVLLLYGNRRMSGAVVDILPVSAVFGTGQTLAAQNPQSTQIARVRFGTGVEPPALNATVYVHMYYTGFAARTAAAVVDFLGLR
jgi:hypothetical protein